MSNMLFDYTQIQLAFSNNINHMCSVMVSVLASSAVDHGFESQIVSNQ
jgi:hypothetical protein